MSELSPKVTPKETGYGNGYQESVRIESKALFGMHADEFYRRQMGLVLDKIPDSIRGIGGKSLKETPFIGEDFVHPNELEAHKKNLDFPKPKTLGELADAAGIKVVDKCSLNLGPGKRILDIAAGGGDTSRYLAATGANVESRDLSEELVAEAKMRDLEVRKTLNGVRGFVRRKLSKTHAIGDVNYHIGDMGDIKVSLKNPDHEKFDVVTCLSRSFIYLLEKEKYEKALKDYYDLLIPGGKLVIQTREHVKNGDLPWSKKMGTGLTETPDGDFVISDHKKGIDFVWQKGEKTVRADGSKVAKAGRYLKYPDGKVVDLGTVVSDDYLLLKNLPMWGEMLKKIGFVNIGIKAQELSPDGDEIMYAIVAEKPIIKKGND